MPLLSALVALCLSALATALPFPDYTATSHPFFTDDQFASLPKSPVILRRYLRRNGGTLSTKGVRFLPGHASYNLLDNQAPFAAKLDALHVLPGKLSDLDAPDYLNVDLNGPARVILLLTGRNFVQDVLPNLSDVDGLPDDWKQLTALQEKPGINHTVPESRRVEKALTFPVVAATVQKNVAKNERIVLPHPRTLKVNGRVVENYVLLFAKQGHLLKTPQAFEYQVIPPMVRNHQTGKVAETEPVVPNETCPDWVHDLYLVESRDRGVAEKEGELPFWRTWHPPIDAVFWCYFTHEHGTYPGRYRPAMGYTAFKTPDNRTADGRQIESHEGFKVLSFPLHDQDKFVVMTVHMHLARARRFRVRHHTVIFAVLDKDWRLELEFHMKADFGFAFAALQSKNGRNREPMPLTARDAKIQTQLAKAGFLAGRRVNILKIDEGYPGSLDKRFGFRDGLQPSKSNLGRIMLGVYEKWMTPLNTCARSAKGQRGFIIDSQNPSTAKKTLGGSAEEGLQRLAGSAENRVLEVPEGLGAVEVGRRHCAFFREGGRGADGRGVFFTDPYFSRVLEGQGRGAVRQFIKPGFEGVRIGAGRLAPRHGWSAGMEYGRGGKGERLMNPENAFFAEVN